MRNGDATNTPKRISDLRRRNGVRLTHVRGQMSDLEATVTFVHRTSMLSAAKHWTDDSKITLQHVTPASALSNSLMGEASRL